MHCTTSHTKSIHEDDFVKFQKQWQEFVVKEITVWNDFHDFWLNSEIPVHLIRYEDILDDPKPALMKLMGFLLNEYSLEGTRIEKYIDIAVKD